MSMLSSWPGNPAGLSFLYIVAGPAISFTTLLLHETLNNSHRTLLRSIDASKGNVCSPYALSRRPCSAHPATRSRRAVHPIFATLPRSSQGATHSGDGSLHRGAVAIRDVTAAVVLRPSASLIWLAEAKRTRLTFLIGTPPFRSLAVRVSIVATESCCSVPFRP